MEWNVRVSGARNPDVDRQDQRRLRQLLAERRFRSVRARPSSGRALERSAIGRRDGTDVLSPVEIRLEPFQERLLELIAVSREHGHHRNLLVSATGTGKTVMAAVDYARLRTTLPRARLLFVAHREEILDQSRATFRHALRDHDVRREVGRRLTSGGVRARLRLDPEPQRAPASTICRRTTSTWSSSTSSTTPPPRPTARLLEHLAAPRAARAHRDARARRRPADPALVRRPHRRRTAAVGRDRATPARAVRLLRHPRRHRPARRAVAARAGLRHRRAERRLHRQRRVGAARLSSSSTTTSTTSRTMRCLGFCVSVEHARFMAAQFRRARHRGRRRCRGHVRATNASDALRDLADGRVQVVFSVDLFNEGVDVPAVDTVLMLRPTESPTLFLQQLGRGLRKAPGQDRLHRPRLRRHAPPRVPLRPALPRAARRHPHGPRASGRRRLPVPARRLPHGARPSRRRGRAAQHPRSDPVPMAGQGRRAARAARGARRRRRSPSTWPRPVSSSSDVYAGNRGWSDLREAAGLERCAGRPARGRAAPRRRPDAARRRPAADRRRTDAAAQSERSPTVDVHERARARLARMLVANLADPVIGTRAVAAGRRSIWCGRTRRSLPNSPNCSRCCAAASTTCTRAALADVPLQIHARYTRIEILAAVGEGSSAPRRRSGARASTTRRPPAPTCWRSPSTRPAATSRPPPATATTRSAAT